MPNSCFGVNVVEMGTMGTMGTMTRSMPQRRRIGGLVYLSFLCSLALLVNKSRETRSV